ncbi:hydroxyectoine utilization dehydratase EutB [Roseitranquillus sediminis]|uniref:hydroxyectoine utilization dehydratase EutB n=1 Tax=Roseitranquillus sediminis TaxID=2809051 RepID=UPI001D0C0302|nr:hydroxyectoine utilization dehydratase EutB [Roseitranquillus sediminis]MBM9593950.1 hydroxyectoine utilization dehydratase EutB [Roseitranquillus sediminis]
MTGVTADDIAAARERIAGLVRRTPCDLSPSLQGVAGAPVWLKHEHHQTTGSFKLRGASNAVASLGDAERAGGVVGASTGNHGRALAHAARRAGLRCVICMSALVPRNKVDAIAAEGAEIVIVGRSQDDAQEEVDRLVAEEGMTMIPPFDHQAVIAGQGTLGLEMLDDVPDLETAVIPLSGGGLIAGIAAALKSARPEVRVVGISMTRGAAMHASLAAGEPTLVEELPTLADSLGGGIGLGNRHTFAMVRNLVDEVVLLSEAEIAEGVRHCYWQERQVLEGGAAVGPAALLAGRLTLRGPSLLLLSGCNIDMALHHRLISGENVDLMREAE